MPTLELTELGLYEPKEEGHGVVRQNYAAEAYDEFVISGNTAVMRCQVPAFVSDYVTVTSWIEEPTGNVIKQASPSAQLPDCGAQVAKFSRVAATSRLHAHIACAALIRQIRGGAQRVAAWTQAPPMWLKIVEALVCNPKTGSALLGRKEVLRETRNGWTMAEHTPFVNQLRVRSELRARWSNHASRIRHVIATPILTLRERD
ncbi:hypothetical protein HPB47_026236 [Ixodes persulcatus]|uniref:Uncharacterized protein n=1 Tax=Ixodes persulcatus TaxID=34615 RepID=A0AC60PZY8_IXOPE|nr:hypothetical protein HPB47_026236 [Ixodes persulcatus]